MAIYWMTEALPLAITSLLPVVLFPLLGIMDTGKVCTAYMKVCFYFRNDNDSNDFSSFNFICIGNKHDVYRRVDGGSDYWTLQLAQENRTKSHVTGWCKPSKVSQWFQINCVIIFSNLFNCTLRLMLGFMFTTMFLSMWISNTATTAMVIY